MTDEEKKADLGSNLDDLFRNSLNANGYSFQYAVVRAANELFGNDSQWMFVAAEFPVTVKDRDTRIDCIFRLKNSLTYLIGECKRANPALSDWCFVRAPYTRRNPNNEKIIFEQVRRDGIFVSTDIASERSANVYHIGLEVRSGVKGDTKGQGRGAIEDAAGQVCKGVNGFATLLSKHGALLKENHHTSIVPAIFTTAKLFVSEVDISLADIEEGKLKPGTVKLKEEPWIWLNYNVSPALRHEIPGTLRGNLEDVLETEFTRSIAIISVRGIKEFLERDWWFMR